MDARRIRIVGGEGDLALARISRVVFAVLDEDGDEREAEASLLATPLNPAICK